MDIAKIITVAQVLVGIAILFLSVIIALKTRNRVSEDLRRRWAILISFLVFFILGYFLFLYIVSSGIPLETELITGLIFLAGACFVILVLMITKTTVHRVTEREHDLEIYNDSLIARTAELEDELSERFKAEKSLAESEERYRSLLETANDLIQIVSPDGTLRYANRAWRATLGYSPEEITGLKVFDIIHPDYAYHCAQTFRGVQESGSVGHFETKFLTKDGREVLLEGSCNCTFKEGKPSNVITIFRDITERRRIEEQLVESKADWEETFDTITDMITIHDKDLNIIRANKAAKDILDLPDLNVNKSIKCFERFHGTTSPLDNCPSCVCMKTGEPASIEMFEPRLDKHLEIRAIPRFDSNRNVIGSIHIVRDITDSKKLEEQLHLAQKMEAIGTLTGGVAHEFNNILTAILGFGEILQGSLADGSAERRFADMIVTSSERASKLTDGLLAYSRKQRTVLKPLDVNEALRTVNDFLSPVKGEHIRLELKTSDEYLQILADKAQIEQVLMNLATNAMDAMKTGGTLTFESKKVYVTANSGGDLSFLAPGEYALIEVRDTGEGMDHETLQKAFEPFFTTKDVGKGTGLGLAVVYGIVKKHKGHITAESAIGEGTTFRLYLPLSYDEAPTEALEAMDELPGGSETILLAEDDPQVRDFLHTVLGRAGYSVINAEDGLDAIEQFRRHKESIDLIILDVGMPHMTGSAASEIILKERPSSKILFLSGYTDNNIEINKITERGAQFIKKPVFPMVLLEKIREIIESH